MIFLIHLLTGGLTPKNVQSDFLLVISELPDSFVNVYFSLFPSFRWSGPLRLLHQSLFMRWEKQVNKLNYSQADGIARKLEETFGEYKVHQFHQPTPTSGRTKAVLKAAITIQYKKSQRSGITTQEHKTHDIYLDKNSTPVLISTK